MKCILSIFFILNGYFSLAQSTEKCVIQELYVKSIQDYFDNPLIKDSRLNKNIPILLIKDSLPENLPLIYKNFTIKLVKNKDEAVNFLIKKRNKTGVVYMITRRFKNDTLDIQINDWGIKIKKALVMKNEHATYYHINFLTSCGGTMGYIPTGRMIYNKDNEIWSFLSSTEVIAEKRKLNLYF